MFLKVLKILAKAILILIAFGVFIFYCHYLFKPYCFKLGYTLCAAIGEDFFALYQAAYNFFHNFFIYGELAKVNIVTPYFMIFKYFPITPLLIGWPFLCFFTDAESAYQGYLILVFILFILSGLGIYFLTQKFKNGTWTKILLFVLWFTYFPILSDLRMGQFNLLASLFFLLSIVGLAYRKQLLNILSWIISLVIKPIALLNFCYYWKTKNTKAIVLFVILFVIFTIGYLGYYQLYYPRAVSEFSKTVLLINDNRSGWQMHYPDNFSVNSFLGELFYNTNPLLFDLISKYYIFLIVGIFAVITWKIHLKADLKTDIYYSLYAFATLIMSHKEVWESWLTCWLVIIIPLIILASDTKEKLFLFINGFILGTPSLFFFYELYKTNLWRFFLISEKAIPQILVYGYLVYKIFIIMKKQIVLS